MLRQTFTSFLPPLLLSAGAVLVLIPWLFFGFHYSDVGWNASKALLISTYPSSAYWELSWLSSMLAGLWMQCTEVSLLWLRIGYLLCLSGTICLTYSIFRLYYRPARTILALIPALGLYVAGFEQFIPTYYTIPPLFALASMYFLLKSVRSDAGNRWALHSFLSGLFFSAMIQARFPSGILGLVFIAVAFIEMRHGRPFAGVVQRLIWNLAGLIAGTAIITLLLYLSGNLEYALRGIARTFVDVSSYDGVDNIHHPARLLADTAIRWGKVGVAMLLAIVGGYGWKRWCPEQIAESRWLVPLLLLIPVLFLTFLLDGMGPLPMTLGTALVLLLSVPLWSIDREKLQLYAVALGYLVLMNLGSSNPSTGSMKYTALLILPLALLESRNPFSRTLPIPMLRTLVCVLIGVMFVMSRFVYHGDILEATETFDLPVLSSVYGKAEDVSQVQAVVKAMEGGGLQAGDTTLCYVDIPIFHFVTGTIPALRNPWISDRSVGVPSLARVRSLMMRSAREGTLPKFVVRAQTVQSSEEYSTEKLLFLDSLWLAEGYDTLLQTGRFTVLVRPSREGEK